MAELKTVYEKGWEGGGIHVDIPAAYKENYQIRMLRDNSIPHLLRVTGSGRDGTSRYTFHLESGIQMEESYSSREMKAYDILAFTEQFLETADSLREHMINPDGLLLTPELIVADNGTFWFCYLPAEEVQKIYKKTLRESFHEMTEYFIKRIDYRETEAILLVYRLHKETMQDNYDIRKILDEYREEYREYKKEEKDKNIRKDEEKEPEKESQRENTGQSELSDGTIFFFDSDDDNGSIYSQKNKTSYLKEKVPAYGPVKRAIAKIKSGRWGEWEDMITEIDGQNKY